MNYFTRFMPKNWWKARVAKDLETCVIAGLITYEEMLRLKAGRAESELDKFLKKGETKKKR